MPFKSRKQQNWYYANKQTFLNEKPHSERIIAHHADGKGKVKFFDVKKNCHTSHNKKDCEVITLKNGKTAIRKKNSHLHRIVYNP